MGTVETQHTNKKLSQEERYIRPDRSKKRESIDCPVSFNSLMPQNSWRCKKCGTGFSGFGKKVTKCVGCGSKSIVKYADIRTGGKK